jgi:tRNA G18 (ribose-2'-O)-methylase SpoU
MFATVVHNLKSPENVGMIMRAHVAFGGEKFVLIGSEPWRFKKRAQAFSRRLENICDIIYLPDDDAFFSWCLKENFTPVAIEISETATLLPSFDAPVRPAIIVGHEAHGLPTSFLQRCAHVVRIPQFGPVGCLNAAVSCCIALYEINRLRPGGLKIAGDEYIVENKAKSEWGRDGNA